MDEGAAEEAHAVAIRRRVLFWYVLVSVASAHFTPTSICSRAAFSSCVSSCLLLFAWCVELAGGALLSALYALLFHGDDACRGLLVDMFLAAYRPLRDSLVEWLCEGRISDPANEFMIDADPSVPQGELWAGRFVLSVRNTPVFIDAECARHILVVGKLLNVLRLNCRDDEWNGAIESNRSELCVEPDRVHTGSGLDFSRMKRWIVHVSRLLSHRTIYLLHTKFDLLIHLAALKQFVLLAQGDFAEALIGVTAQHLSEPASGLYKHAFAGYIEQAIRSSSARYAPEKVRDCVDLRLLSHRRGDDGWDVFCMHYEIDVPLNMVVTKECQEQYKTLFRFLWKLKRVEWVLSGAWKHYVSAERLVKVLLVQTGVPATAFSSERRRRRKAARRRERSARLGGGSSSPTISSHDAGSDGSIGSVSEEVIQALEVERPAEAIALRHEMVHFVSNLQYYVGMEVLDCGWSAFVQDVDGADDIETLISAHAEYCDAMLRGVMLTPDRSELLDLVNDLFSVILDFCALSHEFHSRVAEEVAVRRIRNRAAMMGTETRQTSSTSTEPQGTLDSLVRNVRHVLDKIGHLRIQFSGKVKRFIRKVVTETDSDSLLALSYRLDFSEYYTTQGSKRSTGRIRKG